MILPMSTLHATARLETSSRNVARTIAVGEMKRRAVGVFNDWRYSGSNWFDRRCRNGLRSDSRSSGVGRSVRATAERLSRDLAGDPKHIYKYKIQQGSAPSRGS